MYQPEEEQFWYMQCNLTITLPNSIALKWKEKNRVKWLTPSAHFVDWVGQYLNIAPSRADPLCWIISPPWELHWKVPTIMPHRGLIWKKSIQNFIHSVKQTRQDVPYFSSFIAKEWLNNLEDICQGQRSLCMKHPLMPVIICARYGKNPSKTVHVVEQTWQDVPYFSSFTA